MSLLDFSRLLPTRPPKLLSATTARFECARCRRESIRGGSTKGEEGSAHLSTVLERLGFAHSPTQQGTSLNPYLSVAVLVFVLIGLYFVNRVGTDESIMRIHPKPLDEDFPEQGYKEKLKRFCTVLQSRLDSLDEETKWDDYYFAPLEAEVEVVDSRQVRKRKIVDLMHALKADRQSRVILVLGDPGAGKSIALRKLTKELLRETDRTGRIPIYVNLKEWTSNTQWSEQQPPRKEDLRDFVLGSMRSHNIFADQFLEEYFSRMLDRGRFFFVFDSFDEIPSVLDVSESSWLTKNLSELISEFFVGQDSGRGIVASRFYRRPKFSSKISATFEIRPFSDLRIHEALMRSGKLREETVEELFTTRSELVPVARNPFSAALIRMYAENSGGGLPQNQLEMYQSYVASRLGQSAEQLTRRGLSSDAVSSAATEIAWSMFHAQEIGLEASVSKLSDLLPHIPVQDVAEVLRYAGLARLGPVSDPRFSFVHRRLSEYFVARRILEDPSIVTFQAIPTDSRYRDALALYCEVGAASHVSAIADFCWSEIEKAPLGSTGAVTSLQLRAVHCLRFLRDAFRTRPECLRFIPDLARYIDEKLSPEGDLLSAKLALETTGLLPEELAEPILVKAFEMGNLWISETALHACRHMKRISTRLEEELAEYLGSIGVLEFLARYKELAFSLSLSDGFRATKRDCQIRIIDSRAFVCGLVSVAVGAPLLFVGLGSYYLLMSLQRVANRRPTSRTRPMLFFRRRMIIAMVRLQAGMMIIMLAFTHRFGGPHSVMNPHKHSLIPTFVAGINAGIEPGFLLVRHSQAFLLVIIYVGIGLLLIPWFEVVVVGRLVLRSMWSAEFWKGVPLLLRKALLAVVAYGLVMGGGLWVAQRFSRFESILFIVLGSILLAGFGFTFAIVTWRLWRDRKRYIEITRATVFSRASIAKDLSQLQSHRYRDKYVQWLRDTQVQPQGEWPDGRPNSGDVASTVLAQLDERWLGLEG